METVLCISNNQGHEKAIKEVLNSYDLKVNFCNENDAKFKLKGQALNEWSAVIVDTCLTGILNKYLKRLEDLKTPIIKYQINDIETAIEDLLGKIKVSPTRKIDTLYGDVFDIIQEYWDNNARDTLRILKSILIKMHDEDPDRFPDLHNEYPRLRKVIQFMFQVCLSFGLLPEYCKATNLTQCACTLAGKPKLIYDKEEKDNRRIILPRQLREALWSIIQAGNAETHTSVEDFSWMLLQSYTLKLCELISWIREYVYENPDKEQNAKLYEIEYNKDPQRIEEDSDGFFHCGEIQLPKSVQGKKQAKEKIAMENVIMNTDLNTRYPYICLKYQ